MYFVVRANIVGGIVVRALVVDVQLVKPHRVLHQIFFGLGSRIDRRNF
jgi:hypothetical protein